MIAADGFCSCPYPDELVNRTVPYRTLATSSGTVRLEDQSMPSSPRRKVAIIEVSVMERLRGTRSKQKMGYCMHTSQDS